MSSSKCLTIGLLLLSMLYTGCASPYVKAQREYFKGNPSTAEKILTPVSEKEESKDGRMKNLYFWDLGVYRFSQKDYEGALDCFMKSVKSYEKIQDTSEGVKSAFTSSSSQQYLGDPVEISMAYLYIGLCYYMLGDYEKAMVGLRRSREEDLSKDEVRQGDMSVTNFVMGECFSRIGEYDDAVAAYRRAIQHAPDLVPAYIGCYYALKKQGDETNVPNMLGEIEKRVDPDAFSSIKEHSGNGVTVIIFSGRASRVQADAFLGAFRQRKELKDNVTSWEMSCKPSDQALSLRISDELHTHFNDQGGLSEEAKHQATRAVVGTAMKQIPCVGLFAPDTSADIRFWPTMPGFIYVGYYSLDPGVHDIEVRAFDKRHRLLDSHSKSWTKVDIKENTRTLLVSSAYGS